MDDITEEDIDVIFSEDPNFEVFEEAKENFLSRYENEATRIHYTLDLDIWMEYCESRKLDPMTVRRQHIEQFITFLSEYRKNSPRSVRRRIQTVRSFYKLAAADNLISYDPTFMLRMPKVIINRDDIPSLDRFEVIKLLKFAEEESPAHHAMVALMSMLGLRVSEVCSVDIEDFKLDKKDYVILRVKRKGGEYTKHPISPPLFKIIKTAKGDRENGPLILTKAGNRQTRNGAYAWMKILLKKAELNPRAHPHTLRHSSITALIDAGEPIHKVQEFANHKYIGTTEMYYRRSHDPALHPAHLASRLFSY